jgi:hypothetical protein
MRYGLKTNVSLQNAQQKRDGAAGIDERKPMYRQILEVRVAVHSKTPRWLASTKKCRSPPANYYRLSLIGRNSTKENRWSFPYFISDVVAHACIVDPRSLKLVQVTIFLELQHGPVYEGRERRVELQRGANLRISVMKLSGDLRWEWITDALSLSSTSMLE